jgi:hypothetical protein
MLVLRIALAGVKCGAALLQAGLDGLRRGPVACGRLGRRRLGLLLLLRRGGSCGFLLVDCLCSVGIVGELINQRLVELGGEVGPALILQIARQRKDLRRSAFLDDFVLAGLLVRLDGCVLCILFSLCGCGFCLRLGLGRSLSLGLRLLLFQFGLAFRH